MFCSSCGKQIGSQIICPYCGNDMTDQISSADTAPDLQPEQAVQDPTPDAPTPAPDGDQAGYPYQAQSDPIAFGGYPGAPVTNGKFIEFTSDEDSVPNTGSAGYPGAPVPKVNYAGYTYQAEAAPDPIIEHPKKKKKKKGLIIGIAAGAVVLLAGAAVLFYILTAPSRDYDKAKDLMNSGDYQEAIEIFTDLGDYEDSAEMIKECRYLDAQQMISDGKYDEAIAAFEALGDYKESRDLITKAQYEKGKSLYNAGEYDKAIEIFTALGDYRDSTDMISAAKYEKAKKLCDEGNFDEAIDLLDELGDYPGSADLIDRCRYEKANDLFAGGEYEEAKQIYKDLDDYSDSSDRLKACDYEIAKDLIDSDPSRAIALFVSLGDYQDSKALLSKAKMNYCEQNDDNTNTTTYQYLTELKKASYPGAATLYDKLYAYRITEAFWNTDADNDDPSSGVTSISKKYHQVLHFTLEGGTPDDTSMQINYTVTWPDGSQAKNQFDRRASLYTITLNNDMTGKIKVEIYTQDKKLLYTAYVTVV